MAKSDKYSDVLFAFMYAKYTGSSHLLEVSVKQRQKQQQQQQQRRRRRQQQQLLYNDIIYTRNQPHYQRYVTK